MKCGTCGEPAGFLSTLCKDCQEKQERQQQEERQRQAAETAEHQRFEDEQAWNLAQLRAEALRTRVVPISANSRCASRSLRLRAASSPPPRSSPVHQQARRSTGRWATR
jgi:hypothetical protein